MEWEIFLHVVEDREENERHAMQIQIQIGGFLAPPFLFIPKPSKIQATLPPRVFTQDVCVDLDSN